MKLSMKQLVAGFGILSMLVVGVAGGALASHTSLPHAADVTRPSCRISRISTGGIVVRIQDAESGLDTIQVTDQQNANVVVPAFTPGTNNAVSVRATRADPSQPGRFRIRATDVAGNETRCTTTAFIYV